MGSVGNTNEIEADLRKMGDSLQGNIAKFRLIDENISDFITILDVNGIVHYASTSHEKLFGIPSKDIEGKYVLDFVHPDDAPFLKTLFNNLIQLQHYDPPIEYRYRHGNGNWVHCDVRGNPVLSGGKVIGVVATVRDITRRKQEEVVTHHLVYHDELTGLPNRRFLIEQLTCSLNSYRIIGKSFSLLFLDLDGFKQINDTLGHTLGDQVLQIIAARLVDRVDVNGVVTRLGGDEFMILLANSEHLTQSMIVVENIMTAFAQPVVIDGKDLHVTGSMGICGCPSGGEDIDKLMMNVDIAMYRAKNSGKNRYYIYTSDC